MRGGGGSLSVSLATAATSPPPSPLARKREVGVGSFLSRRPPCHHHPLSLANARWGWVLLFSRDGRHVTTTIPSRLQTRGGGGFFFFLATAATSPLPSPLTRKREVGVGSSFLSRRPPHHHHPLSLANARWGWVLALFSRDGRHITTNTPSRSHTRGGGVFSFFSLTTAARSPPTPPLARTREVGVCSRSFLSRRLLGHHHHPLSLTHARWGWVPILFTHDGRHVTATTPFPRNRELGVVLHII
jgi:hypothetical protein